MQQSLHYDSSVGRGLNYSMKNFYYFEGSGSLVGSNGYPETYIDIPEAKCLPDPLQEVQVLHGRPPSQGDHLNTPQVRL